jgi:hypothetical protein
LHAATASSHLGEACPIARALSTAPPSCFELRTPKATMPLEMLELKEQREYIIQKLNDDFQPDLATTTGECVNLEDMTSLSLAQKCSTLPV